MAAWRYAFYFLKLKTMFYSLIALIRKLLFLPLQNVIHIFATLCNILYIYTPVYPYIPYHRKYSQSEYGKAVVYSTVMHRTFPSCAAILFSPKFIKGRAPFPVSLKYCLSHVRDKFSLGINFEVENTAENEVLPWQQNTANWSRSWCFRWRAKKPKNRKENEFGCQQVCQVHSRNTSFIGKKSN